MRSITVDVDVDDVLDEFTDAELVAELQSRGLSNEGRDAVRQAIKQIHRGDHMDAVTTLERQFLPKWESSAQASGAYKVAMRT